MELIEPKVFLLARTMALAEAQALSLAHASGSAPPPPTPTPLAVPRVNVGDHPAGGGPVTASQPVVLPVARAPVTTVVRVEVEGEDPGQGREVPSQPRQGSAHQPMAGFGALWSGNAQLLWVDGTVGAVLDLIVDIAVAGKYAVHLYPTRAPDYGNFKMTVDGKQSSVPFTGFDPKVMPTGRYLIGTFFLQPGPRRVRLTITGRSPKSTGYLVGIDRITLTSIESR